MKILILSPLFPPDTGAPADYVKELAARLAPEHETKLLVYGYLPESVTSVTIQAIDKRSLLPFRLFSYTKALLTYRDADLLLVQNAPSVELPLLLARLILKVPYVLVESDPIAAVSSTRGFYKQLHSYIKKSAKKVIALPPEATYKKAEVLPFVEFDAAGEARRQTWWNDHVTSLLS